MAAADLTGNGRADLVCGKWVFEHWLNDDVGDIYWFEQPEQDAAGGPWKRHSLASGWRDPHDIFIGNIAGAVFYSK